MASRPGDMLSAVVTIARQAGDAIMPFYQSSRLSVSHKTDNTPLTQADLVAHEVIVTALSQLSKWPILSEEGQIPDYRVRRQWQRYWIVDPLDGTRGFIKGLNEFTVNIALIEQHQPVLGVLYAPARKVLFFAGCDDGAFVITEGMRKANAVRLAATSLSPLNQLRFVTGRYHRLHRLQPVLDKVVNATILRLNSSLKFTEIVESNADVYARFGPISEWDIAAGHCILAAAGGSVVDFDGKNLQYNASESLQCPPFLAVGHSGYLDTLIRWFKEGEHSE